MMTPSNTVNDDNHVPLHPSMYILNRAQRDVAAGRLHRLQRNVKRVIEKAFELSNLLCLFIYLEILMPACSPSWL